MKARNIVKKDNTYYSDFTNSKGKRVRKSLGKDLAQARIKVLQLMADIDIQNQQVGTAAPNLKSKSYLSALNEYIESIYGVKDATSRPTWHQWKERQAQAVMNLLWSLQKSSDVNTVNAIRFSHLDRFLTERAHEVQSNTINKNIQWIKRFFGYCSDREWLVKDPSRKLKKLKATTPFRYHFKKDEIQMVLDNAGNYKDFFVVAMATGLRACDMWELSTSDFEVIEDAMYLKIWEKKTGQFLYLPIAKEARTIIENTQDRLFPNSHEELWRKGLLRNLQGNFSRSYCRKWNIRLHTLRHTFAMRCGEFGLSKEVVQQFLGHSSVKTTEIYFNQLPKEALKEALTKLPNLV